MITLYNLSAIGQTFSVNGGLYTVAGDGTVQVADNAGTDIHSLIAQGFQYNAANPLHIPFLGVLTEDFTFPLNACAVVVNATDPATINGTLPDAALCNGAFFFVSNMGDGAATVTPSIATQTVQGDAGPIAVGPSRRLYSDGSNFYLF